MRASSPLAPRPPTQSIGAWTLVLLGIVLGLGLSSLLDRLEGHSHRTQVVAGQPPVHAGAEQAQTHSLQRARADAPPARRRSSPSDPDIWFSDLGTSLQIDDREQDELRALLWAPTGAGKAATPPWLIPDRQPRLLFASLARPGGRARTVLGSGRGLLAAVGDAMRQLQVAGGASPLEAPSSRLVLDIVGRVEPLHLRDLSDPIEIERGLDGVAFERDCALAFSPMEVLSQTLVNSDGEIRRANLREAARSRDIRDAGRFDRCLLRRDRTLYRFTTTSFLVTADTIEPLLRGHRVIREVESRGLLRAARAGGDYLVRSISATGRFTYAYLPKTGEVAAGYNMLRHSGTIVAMLELLDATGDTRLLDGARRAIDYLVDTLRPCGADRSALCVVEDGHVKLGGNALAILALVDYDRAAGDDVHLPAVRRLARWIRQVEARDGHFMTHKMTYPGEETVRFRSSYYPGEAILALSRAHQVFPDDTANLDAARRAADFRIDARDDEEKADELDHDQWLLYSLDELHRLTGNQDYVVYVRRLAGPLVAAQNRSPRLPDWLGSFKIPPRSTPTATRSEGLCAAYRLLARAGEIDAARPLLEAARYAARFQLQTQFGPEAIFVADPERVQGGFHRSLTDFEIRIDTVQHNISSLLALRAIMQPSPGKDLARIDSTASHPARSPAGSLPRHTIP